MTKEEPNNSDLFYNAKKSFFQRNQTSFLSAGFQSLLTTYIPHIVQTHGTVSAVINGLKYGFSLTNVCAFNSGVHLSEAFKYGLSSLIPITADFTFDVIPLLAVGKQEPQILAKVRSVVFQLPMCSGRSLVSSAGMEDPEVEERTLNDGLFICGGRMHSIPCIKSLYNNMVIRKETKTVFRLQVRCGHEGNRTIHDGNFFRFTSSMDFEIPKQIKRTGFEGVITCKLPGKRQHVHIGVLAQALGCSPQRFVEFIRCLAGDLYDGPTFRCYEIDILYRQQAPKDQKEAFMILSKLSGKDVLSTGINLLKTEIFPHLNVCFTKGNQEALYFTKLLFLAMCTSHIILFAAGKIKETTRDHWQYANIITPAFHVGQLIRNKFQAHMKTHAKLLRRALLHMFKKPAAKYEYFNLIERFGEHRLSYRIMKVMRTGAFSQLKQGICIPVNDNNDDAMLAQLLRITSSINTTDSTHTEPRKVQHDSYGYSGAASTPDDKHVGLVNTLACTATITVDLEDSRAFCELLSQYVLKPFLLDIISTLLGSDFLPATPKPEEEEKQEEEEDSLSVELVNKVDFEQIRSTYYLFINICGVPTHFVRASKLDALVKAFRSARRSGEICRQAFIKITHKPREIRIFCEGGQIVRPLIVLEALYKAKPSMTFQDMLQNGIIEYMNPAEEQCLCKVVVSMEDLKHAIAKEEHRGLTHMEFTEASFVGIMAARTIFMTAEQGPRLAYSIHQRNQNMCAGKKRKRGSILSTELYYNHAELVHTEIAAMLPGPGKEGGGFPATIVFIALPRDQEDAFIVHQQAVDRGLFMAATTRHYTSEIRAPSATTSERFEKPLHVFSRRNLCYKAVEADGLPRPGTFVPGGEIIIAKTRGIKRQHPTSSGNNNNHHNNNNGDDNGNNNNNNKDNNNNNIFVTRRDISQATRPDEEGIVQDVELDLTQTGKRARVSVVTTRRMSRGDKASTNHSQKGVCGEVRSTEDMYFNEITGMVPDVCVSPLGVVSRMTMATIVESLVGKAVSITGNLGFGVDRHNYNGSLKDKIREAGDMLVANGFRRNGSGSFRCGKTGKLVKGEIFEGIIYYKQLIHLAEKKLHYRSKGPRCALTRQPRQGRRVGGGLRFGEMESAAGTAQGASACLQARLRDLSDPFEIFVCKNCQSLAEGNKFTNYAWCRTCNARDCVYIVKVPFTFHLNTYERTAIGVKTLIEIKPKPPLLI